MTRDRGNAQVLPQFNDTKLGHYRVGPPKTSSPNRKSTWGLDSWRDRKVVIIYILINLVFLLTGIVLLTARNLVIPGWVLIGVWALLTFCGLLATISFCIARSKAKKPEDIELAVQVASNQNQKFPCDPVMNRAITNLVYHGQDDCPECRLLRRREDYSRVLRQESIYGSSGSEFLPSSDYTLQSDFTMPHKVIGHVNGAFDQSSIGHLEHHVLPNKTGNGSLKVVEAVVESGSDNHLSYADDGGLYDVTIYGRRHNFNTNNNNNNGTNAEDDSPSCLQRSKDDISTPSSRQRSRQELVRSISDSSLSQTVQNESHVSRPLSRDSLTLTDRTRSSLGAHSKESRKNEGERVTQSRDSKASRRHHNHDVTQRRRHRHHKHRRRDHGHNNDAASTSHSDVTKPKRDSSLHQAKQNVNAKKVQRNESDPFDDYCVSNGLVPESAKGKSYQTYVPSPTPPSSGIGGSEESSNNRRPESTREREAINAKPTRRNQYKSADYRPTSSEMRLTSLPVTPSNHHDVTHTSSDSSRTNTLTHDRATLISSRKR